MNGRRIAHLMGLLCSLLLVVGCAAGPGFVDDAGAGGGAGGGGASAGGGAGGGGGLDAGQGSDAGMLAAMYPGWQLTDIQPLSARFNTSYGLSEFAGRPVVVVLLEGF